MKTYIIHNLNKGTEEAKLENKAILLPVFTEYRIIQDNFFQQLNQFIW